jgi:transcriptional regulator with XRE-family HTH domain
VARTFTDRRRRSGPPEPSPEGTSSRFGQLLRSARMDRGMTLQEVSSKSEISVTYLSDLERGKLTNPTLETLRRVASALRVSLNELLELERSSTTERSYPDALEELRSLPQFQRTLEEQASRFRVSPAELEDEWFKLLAGIRIQNRRPRTVSDFYFLFDAIARTL